MASVKDLLTLSRQAQKLKGELAAERGALKLRAAELEHERKGLLRQPMSRTDLEDALRADLEEAARQALRDAELVQILTECRDRPSARIENMEDRALYLPLPSRIKPEHLVLYFGADRIIETLQPALAALSYDGAGPSLAERRERIKAIDAELAEVARQREELDRVLGEEEPPPVAPGPKVGDTMGPQKDHHGREVMATWVSRPMPGNPGQTTEGWHWHPVGSPPEL